MNRGIYRTFLTCAICVFFFGALFYKYVSPYLISGESLLILDLKGEWSYCVAEDFNKPCNQWTPKSVPLNRNKDKNQSYSGLIFLKRKFNTPKECFDKDSLCNFVFRDIGGNSRTYLNGQIIGANGFPANNESYQRHFFHESFLPPEILRPDDNEIVIKTFSRNKSAYRMQAGPVGVMTAANTSRYRQSAYTYLNLLPLFLAILVIALSVVYLIIRLRVKNPPLYDKVYHGFLISHGLTFLSYSSTFDQELGNILAPTIHFSLLQVSAFFLVFLTIRTTNTQSKFPFLLFFLFHLPILAYSLPVLKYYLGYFSMSETLTRVLFIAKMTIIYVVSSCAICFFIYVRHYKRTPQLLMGGIFLISMACAIHDASILLEVQRGIYFARMYPALYIFGFSWIYFEMLFEHRAKEFSLIANASEVKRLLHDLRAPISAIKFVFAESKIESQQMILANQAIARIDSIMNNHVRSDQSPVEAYSTSSTVVNLKDTIFEIINESSRRFTELGKISQITLKSERSICSFVNREEFKRTISNLITNSFEATPAFHRLDIEIRIDRKTAIITLEDNGPGFEPDILKNLGRYGRTTKSHGNGIGLYSAIQFFQNEKGSIIFSNRQEGGARIEASLPIYSGRNLALN